MENPTSPAIPEALATSLDARPRRTINSFGDILSEFEQTHHGSRSNEGLQGTVVSISPESIFVDIGRKVDGVLPVELFRDAGAYVKVGDKLRVSITGRDAEGSYTLSTIKVERPKDWSALERAFAEKRAIGGVVIGAGEGRIARGCRHAGVFARFAQRGQGSGGAGETGWPGDPVPHHQAGYGERGRGGGSPRDPGRGRGARRASRNLQSSKRAPWCAAPFAASPTSARSSTWAA